NGGIRNKGLSLRSKQALVAYSFLLVPVLFYVIIRIVPALQALSMSFTQEGSSAFTLEHYKQLINDEVFWKSVTNTVLYVVIVVPLQMVFGLLIALAIERGGGRFKWFY